MGFIKKCALGFALITVLAVSGARADMGRVYATQARVSEEGQKAIILHNMDEEVLILGTDIRADRTTGIVRFIPFPSEPTVRLVPAGAFESVARLMKRHRLNFLHATKGPGPQASGVSLRFHKQLGQHDVTVVKINDVSQFRGWVNRFFKGRGLPVKDRYPDIENVVEDYVKRGIDYFVFDFVDVTTDTRFVKPLAYRFKSKDVYYPLKTSNTFGGEGRIDLIFLTPKALYQTSFGIPTPDLSEDLGSDKFPAASTIGRVTAGELTDIYPDARKFFGKEKIYLQLVSCHGVYHFKKDLFRDPAKGFDVPDEATAEEYRPSPPGEAFTPLMQRLLDSSSAPGTSAGFLKMDALGEGGLHFALEMYKEIRREEKDRNIFFSPFSIDAALAMTYAGARGDTERQMAVTLHFPSREKLDPAFSKRLKDLKTRSGKGCTLKIANALWGQTGFGFRKEFLDRIDRYYGGAFKKVDFVQHPGKSLRAINTWADTATSGKIAHLLTIKDITRLTRLVLTNAVYFKGEWASRFQKENTTPSAFHVGPDVSVTVPMMRQTGKFKYANDGTVQVLELPYKGNALSMVVLLPRGNLADLEANLTAFQLHRWLAALESKTVEVLFPKCTLDAKYSLGSTLATMGMPDAFDERAADFSGMDGKKDLFIFKVIHQANIVVNEEGSEAAAATAVVMNLKSAPMFDVFRADHPFLFLVLDKPTGTILFMGSVVHPK